MTPSSLTWATWRTMPAMRLAPLLLLLACQSAPPVDAPADPAGPRSCNGSPDLCDRPYDRLATVVTHNAFSTAADGYFGPNQTHTLRRQLDDGVRGMMLDIHLDDGLPALCHGVCALGSRPLIDGLAELRGFLDAHPDEVLTLILERYADPALVEAAFEEAGLLHRTWSRPPGSDWPTLAELLDSGAQLLVFDQDPVPDHPWLMHFYTEGWDNDYAARSPADFSCDPLRGDPSHDLFLLNHFLTQTLGSPELAEQVNHQPLLGERIAQCQEETGREVNLVAVDFYEIGDVLEVVAQLNEER